MAYIMIKRSILQENITLLNVYATNKRASKYMRQELIEIQGETDESSTRAAPVRSTQIQRAENQ